MFLLIAFAFLAGIITVLSPCILPILPIILSSSRDKYRPLGVITGFVLSFTFFTLFLSSIVRISGIQADTLRLFSVFVIAIFGISMLVPQFQIAIERVFSKLSQFMPAGKTKVGYIGGLIVGCSVGILWTPCVGPILASVISLAITGTVTFDAVLITFAYASGTAIPMFLIMISGQQAMQRVPWLTSRLGLIQKLFGFVMIATAIAIFFNIDRKFQTFVLNTFPNYGTGLTSFEDNILIPKVLDKKAPELVGGGVWLNSKPLTIQELRGSVVLIDFWTYSCINCQRTFPYLRNWHNKYKEKGLVIIGVHAPEFEFEKDEKNVSQALKDFELTYPVVLDNDFATWRAYKNRYWPAKYIIDKNGNIRYTHFGEGAYDETEKVIQELLLETGITDVSNTVDNPTHQNYSKTQEIYLGNERRDEKDAVIYEGKWNIADEFTNPQQGAKLYLTFEAKEVFLVMRTRGAPTKVRVFLDNAFTHVITVDKDTLYKLISLPKPGTHTIRLEFDDNNTELYAFTFG